MMQQRVASRRLSVEHARSKAEQGRRGAPKIVFQGRHRLHRIVIKVEAMRLDHALERFARQGVLFDGAEQFGRDRVAGGLPVRGPGQKIAPPLQADFAGERLADVLADAGDLEIERVQRQQRPAQFRLDEQRRGVAFEIAAAHEARAMGCIRLIAALAAHGTAIRPAATRRRSPIMML
jgi:hypothetical protein